MLVGRVTRALPFADDWVHLWCETNHGNARTIAEQDGAAKRSQPVNLRANGNSVAAPVADLYRSGRVSRLSRVL